MPELVILSSCGSVNAAAILFPFVIELNEREIKDIDLILLNHTEGYKKRKKKHLINAN